MLEAAGSYKRPALSGLTRELVRTPVPRIVNVFSKCRLQYLVIMCISRLCMPRVIFPEPLYLTGSKCTTATSSTFEAVQKYLSGDS